MKKFESTFLDNSILPSDSLIYNALIDVGYEGFIPKTFIADLLILSKYKLLVNNLSNVMFSNTSKIDYFKSLCSIIESSNILHWVRDTMYIVKKVGKKCNLRTIENYAKNGLPFDLSNIPSSFNYQFDIKSITSEVQQLLNITKSQYEEIEKLPEDIIEILTIANGLGSFLKTSKQIVSKSKQMSSYGDITKIHKHLYADPLFKYKFSIKSYDIDSDAVVTRNSNKIVIGYYFGNYQRQGLIGILIKLLGTIVLNNFTEGVKIIIYSFYIDTYSKKELSSVEEVIEYFSGPKQLKLFSISNTLALENMINENPGDDIILLPNILNGCYLSNSISGSNRVNIISVSECQYNLQYSNVCKKTGGTFLTL